MTTDDASERWVASGWTVFNNPDHAWEKVVFGPWHQERWDANDTVLIDPASACAR